MTVTPELNNRPNKMGHYAIYIRITQNRRLKRLAIGYAVKKEDWNPERKEVRRSNPLYAAINAAIKAKVIEAEQASLQAQVMSKPLTAYQLKMRLKKELVGDCFLRFLQKRIDSQANTTTQGNQQATLNKFKGYLKRDELLFQEVDYDLLRGFFGHLKKIGNKPNTIHKDYKNLRAAWNEAVQTGRHEPERDPWTRLSIKKEKTIRRRLSAQELIAIESLSLRPGTVIYHARCAFLLSFYLQGMRVADLLQLTYANINNGRVEWIASKTQKFTSKKIPPQAQSIIDYFRSVTVMPKPSDYILPFLRLNSRVTLQKDFRRHIESANAQINGHLYEIAATVGIKRFSMHTARHTFANMAIRKSGGNIHAVSDALGHSSIQITEQYFDAAYQDENDSLGELVFGGIPKK